MNIKKELKPYIDLLKSLNFKKNTTTNYNKWTYKDCTGEYHWLVDLTETINNVMIISPKIYKLEIYNENNSFYLKDVLDDNLKYVYIQCDNIDEFQKELNNVILLFKEYQHMIKLNQINNDFNK